MPYSALLSPLVHCQLKSTFQYILTDLMFLIIESLSLMIPSCIDGALFDEMSDFSHVRSEEICGNLDGVSYY